MDRQTTLAFILIGAILIFWLYMNSPSPEEIQERQEEEKKEQVETPSAITDEPVTETQPVQTDTEPEEQLGQFFTAITEQEGVITVETDESVIELTTRGGSIKKYFLKKFNNWYSAGSDNDNVYKTGVQLVNHWLGGGPHLYFVTTDGKAINTDDLNFSTETPERRHALSGDDSLQIVFRYDVDDSRYIQKSLTFFGDKYHARSEIELVRLNNVISNNAFDLIWANGINFVEENSVDEANYSNASAYYGDEQVIVDASDVGKEISEDFTGKIDWIGVRNKYFAVIMVPDNPSVLEGGYIRGNREIKNGIDIREFYSINLTYPFKNTDYEKHTFNVYIGPVDYDILKQYGSKLEAIVDFGSFFGLRFIVRPIAEYLLLPLFTFLHSFIPNYGLVIIIFSLIIKIVLHPLTKSSLYSMKKMQMLQPKITELKEKFKDDPQKMNKETMKLYSTYGVNPMGGCLPLLMQMPIFIALWGLFQVAIDLRQQPFIFWIQDLSRPDLIAQLPFRLPIFNIDQISGLALLMGITTFIQQKMSIKDPKQQMLVYIMPVMLTILFMSFPSGLNLYYFMFNLLSIAQQYYINHKHDGMVLEPVKNPKKKQGFMARMMEAAEQRAKAQQQRKKK